jgi:parallel beta-helix repeat protein
MKSKKGFIRFIGALCFTLVCLTLSVWLLFAPNSFAVEVIGTKGAPKTPSPASLSSTPDIIVNTTSDVIDFGDGRVEDLPGPDGLVSLREAIRAANATPGHQVIGFNIPTTEGAFDGMVFTIRVKTNYPLDPLWDDRTTIDGSTQTHFTGDTNPYGPEIVINGEMDAGGGLEISSAYNVISDLVINGFLGGPHGIGIKHTGANNNLITRCYVGTNSTGDYPVPNDGEGVSLGSAAENNMIINNVISGNTGDGIAFYEFQGLSTQNNVIQGNYIGTDRTGTNLIGNGRCGIGINLNEFPGLIDRNIIGGTEIGEGNIIMGNKCGISITTKDVDGNIIQGNIISKNHCVGIALGSFNALNHTIIGGLTSGSENMITENGCAGIEVSSNGNQIFGNIIANNQLQGIAVVGSKNRISQNSIFCIILALRKKSEFSSTKSWRQ